MFNNRQRETKLGTGAPVVITNTKLISHGAAKIFSFVHIQVGALGPIDV